MDNTSFNSDTYHEVTVSEADGLFNYATNEGFKKEDAFNIFIASGGTFFGGYTHAIHFPLGVISHYNFFTSEGTMVHEVGHCFFLHHTFNNWNTQFWWECEHVTRDETLMMDPQDPEFLYFNADVKGDRVVDTPAMPNFSIERCVELGIPWPYTDCAQSDRYFYIDPVTFDYTGFGTDCQEDQYEIELEDVKNYMAYSPSLSVLVF